MDSSYYYHTVPDSHFWINLPQMINFLKSERDGTVQRNRQDLINFLIKGIENAESQGYKLEKWDEVPCTKAPLRPIPPPTKMLREGEKPWHKNIF